MSCHSNHQPCHTWQHNSDWTAARCLWSVAHAHVITCTHACTHTLGNGKERLFCGGHYARTSVMEVWQSDRNKGWISITLRTQRKTEGINPVDTSEGLLCKNMFKTHTHTQKAKLNLQILTWVWRFSWMLLSHSLQWLLFWLLSWCPETSDGAACAEQSTCEKTTIQLSAALNVGS